MHPISFTNISESENTNNEISLRVAMFLVTQSVTLRIAFSQNKTIASCICLSLMHQELDR